MDKEKKQKLKRLWNKGVPVKEIAEKLGFKSGGNVYYWRKKLGLEFRRKPPGFWNNPENVDRVYDELKEEYGRVTGKMFEEKCGGAFNAIREGRYDPEIRTWNQYVRSREDEPVRKPPGYWDDFENLRKELGPVIEDLGHFPSGPELEERGRSDIAHAIKKHGGYPEVAKRMDYEPRQKPPGFWNNPENVDRVYDELKEEYGRVTQKMFKEKYAGAFNAITKGRYDPEIRTWNQYVRSREDEPVHRSPRYGLETKVNAVTEYFTSDQSQRETARKKEFSHSSISGWSRDSEVLDQVTSRVLSDQVFCKGGLEEVGIEKSKVDSFLLNLTENELFIPYNGLGRTIYVKSEYKGKFNKVVNTLRTIFD